MIAMADGEATVDWCNSHPNDGTVKIYKPLSSVK
jgi:hypothetical protein